MFSLCWLLTLLCNVLLMFPPSFLGLYCCPSEHQASRSLAWIVSLPLLHPPPHEPVPGIPGSGQYPGSLSGTIAVSKI